MMIIIRYRTRLLLAISSLLLFLTTCISPFDPEVNGSEGLLVVDGSLIKGREKQVVIISRTSPISKKEFIPVEKCLVKILNETGNEIVFNEESPGKYVAIIDDEWLKYNALYKLKFTSSEGVDYESDYQCLLETFPVDSVYGIRENHYSYETGTESIKGIQFYVDLKAPEEASRYYRWVMEETWERYTRGEIWGEYDGSSIKKWGRPDSLLRCWDTKNVTGLYSASTVNLSENSIKKIPVNFIEIRSPKLFYKYCATAKQYALNADAYNYWYQKERELNESGGIYTLQPSQPISNIHNISDPADKVMGFFWASSCAVKRTFIKLFPYHHDEEPMRCGYINVYSESEDFDEIVELILETLSSPLYYDDIPEPPVYIERNFFNYHIVLTPQCVDCRLLGGDIQPPDWWE